MMSISPSEQDAYYELSCYTLAHGHPSFIHQHIVDAFAAQTADAQTKPIKLTFGLIGLYLHLEKGLSGKQVQRAHMDLAKQKHVWPSFALPADRGSITAMDVMRAPAGAERDKAIDEWCASVWDAFRDSHGAVASLLIQHGILRQSS